MAEGKERPAPVWPVLILLGVGCLAVILSLVPVTVDPEVKLVVLAGLAAVGFGLKARLLGVTRRSNARTRQQADVNRKIADWAASRNE